MLTLCNPAASLLLRVSRKLVNKAADAAFLMNLGQFTEPRLLVPQLVNEWREGVISELSQHLENAGRVADFGYFVAGRMLSAFTASMYSCNTTACEHEDGKVSRKHDMAFVPAVT